MQLLPIKKRLHELLFLIELLETEDLTGGTVKGYRGNCLKLHVILEQEIFIPVLQKPELIVPEIHDN